VPGSVQDASAKRASAREGAQVSHPRPPGFPRRAAL